MRAKWVLRDVAQRSGQELLTEVSGLAVDSEPILSLNERNEPVRETWIAGEGPSVLGLAVRLERPCADAQWTLSVGFISQLPEYSRRQVAGMTVYSLASLLLVVAAWAICRAAFSPELAIIPAVAVLLVAAQGFARLDSSKWFRRTLNEAAVAAAVAAVKTAADGIENRMTMLRELTWERDL